MGVERTLVDMSLCRLEGPLVKVREVGLGDSQHFKLPKKSSVKNLNVQTLPGTHACLEVFHSIETSCRQNKMRKIHELILLGVLNLHHPVTSLLFHNVYSICAFLVSLDVTITEQSETAGASSGIVIFEPSEARKRSLFNQGSSCIDQEIFDSHGFKL